MDKIKLDDELLENVTGGVLINDKVDSFMGFIPIWKQVGLTKAEFLKAAEIEWKDDFRKFSTTGTKEDFDQFMKKINDEYDTYQWPEE